MVIIFTSNLIKYTAYFDDAIIYFCLVRNSNTNAEIRVFLFIPRKNQAQEDFKIENILSGKVFRCIYSQNPVKITKSFCKTYQFFRLNAVVICGK